MIVLLAFLFSVFFVSLATRRTSLSQRSTWLLLGCTAIVSTAYLRLGFY